MKKKFYIALVILLTLAFTTKVFASLTFDSTSIIGTNSSTIDLGSVSNTLSLQTANNGPIITGTGLFTTGGNLSVTGNVGIGTSSPAFPLHVVGTGEFITIDAIGIAAANFTGRRAEGTVNSPTAVASGDKLSILSFGGYGTTGWSTNKLGIVIQAAEAWTDTAQGQVLRFFSTPIGGINSSERVRIDTNGNVGIGTTTPSAKLHSLATTEQLRLGYDASNYNSFTVGSAGSLTIAGTGTSPTITLSSPVIASSALNKGTCVLGTSCATITVSSGAICTATDTTGIFATKAVVSGTTLTITGNSTDTIAYICL